MKSQRVTAPIWAIVLAGGDGIRVRELSRKIDGDGRPKQFSRIFGDRSLLGPHGQMRVPQQTSRAVMQDMVTV